MNTREEIKANLVEALMEGSAPGYRQVEDSMDGAYPDVVDLAIDVLIGIEPDEGAGRKFVAIVHRTIDRWAEEAEAEEIADEVFNREEKP
jgi:hypothetical protein